MCSHFSDCCPDRCEVCPCVCGDSPSCTGVCGGQHPCEPCFCDEACFAFSDCCPGLCLSCPKLENCGGPGLCPADFDDSGKVDGQDLGLLLLNWGDCPNGKDGCPGDISFDGEVDGEDLGNLLLNWGECR